MLPFYHFFLPPCLHILGNRATEIPFYFATCHIFNRTTCHHCAATVSPWHLMRYRAPPRYRKTIVSPCYRPVSSPPICHIVSLCYHPLCPTVLQPYRYSGTVAPRLRVFIQSWHRLNATITLYDDPPGTQWHNFTIWTVAKNSNDLFNGFSISAMNF